MSDNILEISSETLSETPSETPLMTQGTNLETEETAETALISRATTLRQQGLSLRAIASTLNLPLTRIHRLISRSQKQMINQTFFPLGVNKITRRDLEDRIFGAAPKALKTIENLSDGARKEDVRLRASQDILDRAGFKPVERIAQFNVIEEMNADDLRKSIKQLISAANNPASTNNSESSTINRSDDATANESSRENNS